MLIFPIYLKTKNKLLQFNYWSILMYNYLLPQIGWSWLIFSGPKRSFGRRDSADCKQRGTKWSAEGAERVPSQPASRKPCGRIWYSPTFLQYQILNNQICMLRIKNKLFISLKNGYDFWIIWTKIPRKSIFKIEFGAVHQTGKINPFLPEFCFPSIFRCNPRWTPTVYWLIGAALTGIFSTLPPYLKNRSFGNSYIILHAKQLRVKIYFIVIQKSELDLLDIIRG